MLFIDGFQQSACMLNFQTGNTTAIERAAVRETYVSRHHEGLN